MTGILCWKTPQRGQRPVLLREMTVLRVRMICAEIEFGARTANPLVRRRISKACRKLQGAGCESVILPPDFPWREIPEKYGLRPVSTVPLRRQLAAELAEAAFAAESGAADLQISVSAKRLSGDVVQAVRKLALRHRYVLLDVPYGGEDLCRQLRREYGVSLLLADAEGIPAGVARLVFDPNERGPAAKKQLRLWDETLPLPPLLLPPAMEEQLPSEYDRVQLLSVLLEAGVIRAGQIAVGAEKESANGKRFYA